MNRRLFRAVAALAALLSCGLPACSDDSGDDESAGDGADGGGPAGDGDAHGGGAVETVMLTLELEGSPLEGFEVCNTEPESLGCATSDDGGTVTLEVPAHANVALTVDREGYVPLLLHQRTGGQDATHTLGAPLPTDEQLEQSETALGFELESGKGSAVAFAFGSGGGTFSLSPGDARAYYWVLGVPDPEATTIQIGAAGFYNLDPGEYEITVEVPDKDCASNEHSWPGDAANVITTRVVADRWSWYNIANCLGEPEYTTVVAAHDDADACIERGIADASGACIRCTCESCLEAVNGCGAVPGCMDIVDCASRTGCNGTDCYAAPDTCKAVIDGTAGGWVGAASVASETLELCATDGCADECGL